MTESATNPGGVTGIERRESVRLAGRGFVEAVVLDEHDLPTTVIDSAKVLNVSGGGVALSSPLGTKVGTRMVITVGAGERAYEEGRRFVVRTLECVDWLSGQKRLRCKLEKGHVPASLIFSW